jgi:hypothetical protein
MAVASGKQIPGKYTAMLQSVLSIGLIQDIQEVSIGEGATIKRDGLGLPSLSKPTDPAKFQMVLTQLAVEKI